MKAPVKNAALLGFRLSSFQSHRICRICRICRRFRRVFLCEDVLLSILRWWSPITYLPMVFYVFQVIAMIETTNKFFLLKKWRLMILNIDDIEDDFWWFSMMPSECVRDIEDICWSKGCAFLRLHIHLGEPFEMVFSLRITASKNIHDHPLLDEFPIQSSGFPCLTTRTRVSKWLEVEPWFVSLVISEINGLCVYV